MAPDRPWDSLCTAARLSSTKTTIRFGAQPAAATGKPADAATSAIRSITTSPASAGSPALPTQSGYVNRASGSSLWAGMAICATKRWADSLASVAAQAVAGTRAATAQRQPETMFMPVPLYEREVTASALFFKSLRG
ncbi:hypothetical protein ADT71_05285 [Novosphingobium sp. ST904]|nr:hypothetical protein ADT71_05285 [Novosphingobium sp. ST904]